MMPANRSSGPSTAHGGISVHAGSVQNGDASGSIGGRLSCRSICWVESHERRGPDDHSVLVREWVFIWEFATCDMLYERLEDALEFLARRCWWQLVDLERLLLVSPAGFVNSLGRFVSCPCWGTR